MEVMDESENTSPTRFSPNHTIAVVGREDTTEATRNGEIRVIVESEMTTTTETPKNRNANQYPRTG